MRTEAEENLAAAVDEATQVRSDAESAAQALSAEAAEMKERAEAEVEESRRAAEDVALARAAELDEHAAELERRVGDVVAAAGKVFFVDAMSCFGAVATNLADCRVDYLVSSANKCIEGVPGFSFILAKLDTLKSTRGWARSLTMDLLAQYEGLEKNGQFRFTPPTSALMAFHQALLELEAEGGVAGRAKRYRENFRVLTDGMTAMGFRPYLMPEHMGYIITTFHYPDDANFNFEEFYRRLSEAGYVIYPGKLTQAACFRIGNIGRIFPDDVRALLGAIQSTMQEMNVTTLAGKADQ